ncbi:MAG: tetratricopeptide repeat protein [Acidobacteriota bacterium]|nr:tetratricopeptide repeat protein [Acidobacteriota bacterium]
MRLVPFVLGASLVAGDWMRLKTTDVEVVTNNGADNAGEALSRLTQIRQVLPVTRLARPVRIFIFASSAEYAAFQPNRVHSRAGWYQGGPALDYIVISGKQQLSPLVYHEFAHLFQNQTSGQLPLWYNEGFADLYSTLRFSAHHAEVGAAPVERLEALKTARWLPLDELLAVTEDSPWYRDHAKVDLFYAESWALVHMLHFDEAYRDHLAEFLRRMRSGASQVEAMRIAFGKSQASIYDDLRRYAARGRYASTTVDLPPAVFDQPASSESLSTLASSLLLADLLSATGKGAEAERRIGRLAQKYDSAPELHEQWGAVLLAQGKPDEARQHFARALELGSKNAAAAFELAGLLRDAKADPARVLELLDKAVHLDPGFVPARILLGVIHEREGRYPEAAHQLEIAVRAKPDSLHAWHELAIARFHLGETAGALNAAREARKLAKSREEIAMTDATIQLVQAPLSAAVEADREQHFEATFREVVPQSWRNPEGNNRAEGKLVQLDCLPGSEARFHIATSGKRVVLYVRDPTKVVITGAPGIRTELSCGAMAARDVSVDYIAHPDAKLKADGEITAIRFK